MTVHRLEGVPGFSIDRVAEAAGSDPDVLRLENLDTDLPPPASAIEATKAAAGRDDANSYLPFVGLDALREAAAARVSLTSGIAYEPRTECVITAGGTTGMLNALLALVEEGDEVVLTDPTYAGMIYRVRLAGGRPRFAPWVWEGDAWRLGLDALRAAVGPATRALFLMSPSIPTGAVIGDDAWIEIARLCVARDLWLIHNAAMERILFDGRSVLHPASLPGMRERTVTVGSASKEYRMIGWRTGWVVGPPEAIARVGLVTIYNTVTAVGIAQPGVLAALTDPDAGVEDAVREWERRRDVLLEELRGMPVRAPAGGWSLVLDVAELELEAEEASRRLLEFGRIAATPMTHWGPSGGALVRLVFSNEPVERLRGAGERVRRALTG
ncbi:MAG TPA: pyridoxal phosphate-dependent aminotransferase [Longimicrobiales bacterium]|nr:pyridoxal phosphate-dependent aminotransferase [Longimicrobiales bacterium]